jgi:hypothetical protein
LAHAQSKSDAVGEEVCVDSTVARATSTPRAPPGGGPANKTQKGGFAPPGREALGSSRGGLTAKVRPSCDDGTGRPPSVVLTPGRRHESTQLGALLDAIRVARPAGSPGRPRKGPERLLLAERGYSYPPCLPRAVAFWRHTAHDPRASGPERAA